MRFHRKLFVAVATILFFHVQSCRSTSIGEGSELDSLNGKTTSDYPFVVELSATGAMNPVVNRRSEYRCSAFFVSPEWAMTTDSCVRGPKFNFTLSGGGLNAAPVDKIVRYQLPSNDFDVALLHLENQTYQGKLPNLTLEPIQTGQAVAFAGFGATKRDGSACFLLNTRNAVDVPKQCALVSARSKPSKNILVFGNSVDCWANDIQVVLMKPANKRFRDLAMRECGEVKVEGNPAPDIHNYARYHYGPSVKNMGENTIADVDQDRGIFDINLQAGSDSHIGTIPVEGDTGAPVILNDGSDKVVGVFSRRVIDTSEVQMLRDLNFSSWLGHVAIELNIKLDTAQLSVGKFSPIAGYQMIRQAPKTEQEIGIYNPDALKEDPALHNIGSTSPSYKETVVKPVESKPQQTTSPANGALTTSELKDCNKDHTWILTHPNVSGICLNPSSQWCYQFNGGTVRYDLGHLPACPSK